MTLAEEIAKALPAWFASGFAESVTYEGSVIPAHIDYGSVAGVSLDGKDANFATILVQRSDVPNPQYRDAVLIDGITWTVYQDRASDAMIGGDSVTWEIPITKNERSGGFR